MKIKTNISNRFVLLGDLFLIVIAILGSYVLRLELGAAFYFYLPSAYWMIGVSLLIKPVIFLTFGLYRRIWIYASTKELRLIITAVTAASILVSTVMVSLFTLGAFTGFPRSVLIIDWLTSILLVGGLRFTLRLLAESQSSSNTPALKSLTRKVLIVGAGDAGALVVREMQKNTQLNQQPVGLLDDDQAKQRQQIYGVPVVGAITDLEHILSTRNIDEVVFAIPTAPGRIVRLVADICRLKGIPFRTMPGIFELLGGIVSVSRLREVDITDLLRRETIRIQDERVGAIFNGKVILVTGAGGSIGCELCRQIARWSPSQLIILGHGENSIFEATMEFQETLPGLNIHPMIADVRDMDRLRTIFSRYRPQVVFHTAAHKHVPLMEKNIEESITNNILGTRNLVDIAVACDVERLVLISTDKAICPANVMGATKRFAEMIVLDAAERTGKPYCVVRFGNVLGSRGSVVPLFKRQIARGGPITVTHPDMKRYFMTIPEAVHLVLQAASMGEGADTYVLNMGQQIRILDLAEDLIRLSGLEPGKDIEIVFTGIRPGEKLSEELWDKGAILNKTSHPDILRLEPIEELRGETLRRTTDELLRLAQESDTSTIMQLLDEVIPGATIRSTPPHDFHSID
jgi:FlaA1/EpsC-like NDP-sugar epimerase